MFRIAVGSLMQESNSFVPMKTTLDAFATNLLMYGEKVLTELQGAKIEVSGFLDVLNDAGIEVAPTIAANAVAGGPLTSGTLNHLIVELISRLQDARPLDGVLLALHGAMVAEDEPDADGLVLKAVRETVGWDVPIVATLDLHGHIMPRMLHYADALIGYQEYPHTDMYETGTRAARLLLDVLNENVRPTMAMAKRPMIVSPVNARTAREPLKSIVMAARAMERDERIIHAAVFPVQPWLDVPELGFVTLAVTNDNPQRAQQAANNLADMAWQTRGEFEPDLVTLEKVIRLAYQEQGNSLTVVGDAGDAPSGGSAADNVTVLKTLLDHQADTAPWLTYLTLCDAEAAQIASSAGIGKHITMKVGHKVSDGVPHEISGVVLALSDGVYKASGAGYGGTILQMGLSAVIGIGSIRLCVRSYPSTEWDPGIYAGLGLDLADAGLVFVKSPSHFRASFAPLADQILIADTPGPTCPSMRKLQFRHVTRPLYPLDEH